MIQHFLITRFNLRLQEWQTTKNGEGVVSENWLTTRFELFKNYCLPSVIQQTNQNFKWLVCFDSKTPSSFKAQIAEIATTYSNFVPLYFEETENFLETLTFAIRSFLTTSDIHIITTRMDNDDALNKAFIAAIQKEYKPQDQLIIDLVKGFQLILGTKKDVIRTMTFPFNPFLSLVEHSENFETILSRPHLEWNDTPHLTINTIPLWTQIIHQQNITNSEKLHYPETNVFYKEDFGIQHDIRLKSDIDIILSRIRTLFKRILVKISRTKWQQKY